MRRIALTVLFSTVFAAHTARANDIVRADASREVEASATVGVATAAEANIADAPTPLKLVAPKSGSMAGRAALKSLYAGLAGLQAYDVYSTTKAIKMGAVEMNPLMRGTVGNRAAFIGLKAAMTAGPIVVAERMWRDHRPLAAIAVMAVSNGMMAFVARHNAGVVAQQARR
jgi:hypothetical protein